MYDFASLTLSAVTFAIRCLDTSPSEVSVNPEYLIAGPMADLSLSIRWAVESPMGVLNSLTFLLLLAVLDLFGLKISWFPIHIGETEITPKIGPP